METGTTSKPFKVLMLVVINGTTHNNVVLDVLEPVAIALAFLIGFCANLTIIVTIGSSYRLRRTPFNWIILNFCVVCLLECVFSMSVALYYVTTDDWGLGSSMCSFNAFVVQLVTLEVTSSLSVMCVERWVAAWKPTQFQRLLTVPKQLVAIATMWLSGILLCLPIALGLMESRAYPTRYGCTMADSDAVIHGIFLTLWCYALPVALGGCCLLYLGYRKWKDKRKSKKSESSEFFLDSFLWCEWAGLKLPVLSAILFLILEIPYIAVQQNTETCSCYERNVNATLPVTEWTSAMDTAFTWLRYLYASSFPFLVLWARSDVRKKMVALFACCRKNSIGDMSPRPSGRVKVQEKKKKKVINNSTGLATPVLFATPEGLHIRMLDSSEKGGGSKSIQLDQSVTSNWTSEPRFVSYLCDIDERAIWGEWGDEESFADRRESQDSRDLLIESLEDPKEGVAYLSRVSAEKKKNSSKAKSVRFADTITIFRPETPKLSRFLSPKFKIFPKVSRIPRRINNAAIKGSPVGETTLHPEG